ncbi:MAG: ABC transporter ATP-binding protein [Candidatus ainarchaeum sp.]|nr:ABC transporter ATP-binding protein [Candidatus ainarchaeum sp.]
MIGKPEPLLSLVEVSKLYDGATPFLALDRVSLDVREGEFISIIGPSGSGKSTLLHLLGCLDRPTGGEVFVQGKPLSAMSDDGVADIRRDTIGFVFQAFNLAPTLNVFKNVELPLMIRGVPQKERQETVSRNLETVGLTDKAGSMPWQLSGGQKQRVAIARALANNPKVILADEPTGNLDTKSSREVMDHISSLCRDRGLTVILVTHEQNLAGMADRIVRIVDGRIAPEARKKGERRRFA